jgi:hypothetical protein
MDPETVLDLLEDSYPDASELGPVRGVVMGVVMSIPIWALVATGVWYATRS